MPREHGPLRYQEMIVGEDGTEPRLEIGKPVQARHPDEHELERCRRVFHNPDLKRKNVVLIGPCDLCLGKSAREAGFVGSKQGHLVIHSIKAGALENGVEVDGTTYRLKVEKRISGDQVERIPTWGQFAPYETGPNGRRLHGTSDRYILLVTLVEPLSTEQSLQADTVQL